LVSKATVSRAFDFAGDGFVVRDNLGMKDFLRYPFIEVLGL
jgi:hypothetical protein